MNKYSQRFTNLTCRGFTLLELLVVMVIIGLLASFVGPRYFNQVGKSKVRVANAQIGALESALEQYRLDVDHYPTTDEGLAALNVMPSDAVGWYGPYLRKDIPLDPWGQPFNYVEPGEHSEVDIFSYGADSRAGGTGIDADIVNW